MVEAVKALIKNVTHDALSLDHTYYKEINICIHTSRIDKFCIEVSAKCIEYGRKSVWKEYRLFKKNQGDCVVSDYKYTVLIGRTIYEVTNIMRTCICTFSTQCQLPCRHILVPRRENYIKLFDEHCVQNSAGWNNNLCTPTWQCHQTN